MNCYALIAILASKVVMGTYWQNTIYILLAVLLMCGRGSENAPPSSNKTYLPDYFIILFATCDVFAFLSPFCMHSFTHIPAPLEASD
jgi:hypothetical protein